MQERELQRQAEETSRATKQISDHELRELLRLKVPPRAWLLRVQGTAPAHTGCRGTCFHVLENTFVLAGYRCQLTNIFLA